ncbi:PhzF family phenazine biosynthesis protein [Williamsia sp. CHRR-6]|uniref:PhzF family phenazine biosynthesis protein n=1 Tax=Williamsia sp. CHRR-6 TaxID=2835871 RepID=UPI001BDB4A1D|nr:PhzF family phenazine biosynthesis protein [Williamsia sp. CHRR-6]MBT0566657.1 PhzF family phenazine biosynthesis protein [Williamsia sp. CHRR-6]
MSDSGGPALHNHSRGTKSHFVQLDVFASGPLTGNPLAVVLDAADLTDAQMADFARWTNLSETTFLLPPTDPAADYRVRIFTPGGELPFAGHPTLGSAQAWLDAGGQPKGHRVVQECGVGLVEISVSDDGLEFAAPPLRRDEPVAPDLLAEICGALRVERSAVLDARHIDNGPGWIGVRLASAAEVLALRPNWQALMGFHVGVIGAHTDGPADVEVRGFVPDLGINEDPVTGSLNAGFAQWLIGSGELPQTYTARQGSAIGRAGDVTLRADGDTIWVGGRSVTVISGTVDL